MCTRVDIDFFFHIEHTHTHTHTHTHSHIQSLFLSVSMSIWFWSKMIRFVELIRIPKLKCYEQTKQRQTYGKNEDRQTDGWINISMKLAKNIGIEEPYHLATPITKIAIIKVT